MSKKKKIEKLAVKTDKTRKDWIQDRLNKTLGKPLRKYKNITEKTLKKNAKYLVENDSPLHDVRDLVKQASDKKKQGGKKKKY